jgi:hypothetical protein
LNGCNVGTTDWRNYEVHRLDGLRLHDTKYHGDWYKFWRDIQVLPQQFERL